MCALGYVSIHNDFKRNNKLFWKWVKRTNQVGHNGVTGKIVAIYGNGIA